MPARLVKLVTFLTVAACAGGCTSHSTMPIRDAHGHAIVGSVASLEQIKLGGVPQWILIRGNRGAASANHFLRPVE